ncbi:MAG: N-acetyltransferase [Streptosporangiaceae bacterium]|jgi:L-amino acid N-acyltransferase YncA
MLIRDATLDDWPRIWPFMRQIIAAGETYSWDRGIAEDDARDRWFRWLRDQHGCTVVAVAADGAIMGTAEAGPNHGGPAAHLASASFMVDPGYARQGVGRALGQHVLEWAQVNGYRAIVFNAVVQTNLAAVTLWRELGFEVLATIPEGFLHPVHGYVGLHIMYRRL